MPEFISQLPADDVVWGAFKVVGVDDRGNLVSRRPKFIFVKFMPVAAPSMKRARAGGHKGAIKQIINAHVDIEVSFKQLSASSFFILFFVPQAESAGDLTEDAIIQKLRAAGGAHQPTSYEFSNYSG
jgi:hypothetical protein